MKLSVSMTQKEERWGWLVLALQLLIFPTLLVVLNATLPAPLSDAALNFLLFSVNFIAVLLVFHAFLAASARRAAAAPFHCLRFAAIGLMLYYVGVFLVDLLIRSLDPQFSNINDSSIHAMAQDHYTLILFGTVFLVPVTEETLFRGLIFGRLHRKNRAAAYILSTLIFGLIHITGYLYTASAEVLFLCFLQYVPAGLCLAWAYEKSDTIWTPVLMHMTINQISMSYMR
ncbi:MAG: CPBP family intramembrane metalloprotease [Oscillospiraceae bacterium]|nr:CPBP family intramembrane metalloprotease [Oscillospiraceae bacterium]